MPVFRLQGQDYELTAQELATAPQSLLAEAAALAKPEEAVCIKDWREAHPDAFEVWPCC